MKLLLTSGGVTNPSIRDALISLLGKPIAEANALCIPTAQWGHPACGPASARGFIVGGPPWHTMCGLGWKSVGLLELTALPTIGAERWLPWIREADALLVDGGDATYLCHWMRQSGLADLLPSLRETVWVGVSAGSMVMTRGSALTSWSGGLRRTTEPWGSSTSRSSPTWTIPASLGTPWPTQSDGRPTSRVRHTRWTMRPPLK
jgi:dipeptidase E